MSETIETAGAVNFAALLELEDYQDDVFRGWCHQGSPLRAYGGHLAAQGFMAAARTAPPNQEPASMHAYFVSAASTELPVDYLVRHTSDGRSFSTRSVTGMQRGGPVLVLIAQFGRPEPGPSRQRRPEPVADPPAAGDVRAAAGNGSLMERVIEQQPVAIPADAEPGVGHSSSWIRARLPVGDDLRLQAGAVVYMTDMVLPVAAVQPHVARSPGVLPTASLDHAVWFYGVPRADSWLLFAAHSPVFSGNRGLAIAHVYDVSGVLCASAAQDVLVRNLEGA